jgi:hypothetical protein
VNETKPYIDDPSISRSRIELLDDLISELDDRGNSPAKVNKSRVKIVRKNEHSVYGSVDLTSTIKKRNENLPII